MHRLPVTLVILAGLILIPSGGWAALDSGRLASLCPAQAGRLQTILEAAGRAGLPMSHLETRINEGLLRRVPCQRLLDAIEKEYATLIETRTLLASIHDTSHQALILFANLRSSGLAQSSIISLIAVYGQTRNISSAGSAGLFLLSMKELNWSETQVMPLAELIATSSWTAGQREAIRQLLLYGASLDIERGQTVSLVRSGLVSGRSFHQIRRDLLDRKPFRLESGPDRR